MPTYSTTRRVRHPPQQMFDLVADIGRYPEFLPLCESMRIRSRTDNPDGTTTLVADMTVGYKAIRQTFTSRVVLDNEKLAIQVNYLDGPFRQLDNRWTFRPDPAGAVVEFFISYEFRSIALGMLMGAMFDKAFRKFAEAFERRADLIYRERPAIAHDLG